MLEAFYTKYAQGIVRRRWLCILLSIVVLGITASGAPRIIFDDNYRIFFSPDNPHLQALDALEETYAKEEVILFVLAPQSGDVFTRESLGAVEWLSEEAWQITHSTRVDSVTRFQHSYANEDDIIIENLVTDALDLTDEEVEAVRTIALNEIELVSRLISKTGHVTAVASTLVLPGVASGEREAPIADTRALVAAFEERYPDIDVYLTGGAVLSTMFTEYTMADMTLLTPLMYLLIFVVIGFTLRSVTATLASVIVIMLSVVSALGLAGWFDLHITAPSSAMPTIVMTLAVADCIHVLTTFLQQVRTGSTRAEAVENTIRLNFTPIFITSMTTALGLLTTQFSDVPPLQTYGVMTAMGVGMAWFYSIFFLPALMTILPAPKVKAVSGETPSRLSDLGELVIQRRRPILAIAAIATVGCSLGLYGIEFRNDWLNWFSPSTPFRQDAEFVSDNLSGINALEFSIPAKGPGGISDPEYLDHLDRFAVWTRELPRVDHVHTLADRMKQLNMNMHSDDEEYYRIPEEAALAAQYLLLYEMSLPYGQDLNNEINIDKSATRVMVITQENDSKEVNRIKIACETWLAENAPAYMASKATGNGVMFASIAERTIRGIVITTPIALIVVSLLLIGLFKSVRFGLISLIPNLVPIVAAFGVWGFLFGRINFGVACVAGLSIGIVVDDTVHFMSKYLRARRQENMTPEDAVRYTFSTVGPALISTSVTLIMGFSVMLLSSFKFNANMGLLAAIAIAFALVADLFLLPAVLLTLDRHRTEP